MTGRPPVPERARRWIARMPTDRQLLLGALTGWLWAFLLFMIYWKIHEMMPGQDYASPWLPSACSAIVGMPAGLAVAYVRAWRAGRR